MRKLRRAGRRSWVVIFLGMGSMSLLAQVDRPLHPLKSDRFLAEEPVEKAPQASDSNADVGLAYSSILRDTDPPYEHILDRAKVRGERSAKLGDGAGQFNANFFRGIRLGTPLNEGYRPENAELKLGNFYFDVISLSGTMMASDNINLDNVDRDFGVVAATRLTAAMWLQLGDRLRFGATGALVYLPFEGKVGVSGFGLDDFFGRFSFAPLVQAQIAYDMNVGDWDVELYDDFVIVHRRFGEGVGFELFEGESFDEVDQEGHLRVGGRRSFSRSSGGVDQRSVRLGTSFVEMRNTAGVLADRMLPTVTRWTVGAYRQNSWYLENDTGTKQPSGRNVFFTRLESERESLRFKPYAEYRASKYDGRDWTQRANVGFHGPVTDYISILGEVGKVWYGSGSESTTYKAMIQHNPTPNFMHRIEFRRQLTEPDEDLETAAYYRLRYRINAYLQAEAFARESRFEDLDRSNSGGQESRLGALFRYELGKYSTLRFGHVYSNIRRDDPLAPDTETWTTRVALLYRHSSSIQSELTYQHQIRDSNLSSDSYYENLVVYTLTKFF